MNKIIVVTLKKRGWEKQKLFLPYRVSSFDLIALMEGVRKIEVIKGACPLEETLNA